MSISSQVDEITIQLRTIRLDRAQRFLELWAQETLTDEPVVTTAVQGTDRARRVREFIERSTESTREFVKEISTASLHGQVVTRTQLCAVVHANGEAEPIGDDEEKFRGVPGTAGRRWQEVFDKERNPFLGKFDVVKKDVVYRIPSDLAAELLAALAAAEETQLTH